MHRCLLTFVLAVGGALFPALVRGADPSPAPAAPATGSSLTDSTRMALEALQRLKGMDLNANPAVKGAVLRVLEATRGTPQFVELVRDFELEGQTPGLLDVIEKLGGEGISADAARWLLRQGQGEALRSVLRDPATSTVRRRAVLRALAASSDPAAVPVLTEALLDPAADPVGRALCVQGLTRSEVGARALLTLGRGPGLDETVRNTASFALAQCRWVAIRTEAATVFPLPRAADGTALPSLLELSGQRGDATRGAAVFRSEQAACIKCHRVGSEGQDFGPALTEIGTKLARQALYESILDPSAGISFGYEGWTITTRDGEEVFGIIASETPDEVTVKLQTGAVVKVKTSGIVRREQQKLSIMPAGLGQILTRQQLVDVVEYLAGLRAK